MPCGSSREERPLRMMPLRVSIRGGFLSGGKTTPRLVESAKTTTLEMVYADALNPSGS